MARVLNEPSWQAAASGACRTWSASARAWSPHGWGTRGGDVPNATYRNHGKHAEAIEIVFDPERICFRDLLEFFFQIHDPTTVNRQGNDVGASYRSAIYYTSDEQKQVALDTIADVDASGLWPGKVVTELDRRGPFWEAEPEHQDYLQRNPTATRAISSARAGSCRGVRGPHQTEGARHSDNRAGRRVLPTPHPDPENRRPAMPHRPGPSSSCTSRLGEFMSGPLQHVSPH